MFNQLNMSITPLWEDNTVTAVHVEITFNQKLKENQPLLQMTKLAAGIPGCEPQNLSARDALGDIPLKSEDGGSCWSPHIKRTIWRALREVDGEVCVSYCAHTRILPPGYTASPMFDFRSEKGGANGAGWTFLIFPAMPDETIWHYRISWIYDNLPKNSICVSTLGEDAIIEGDGTEKDIGFSFFAMGLLHYWQDPSFPQFGFFWFDEPNFDMEAVASYTGKLYAYMADFFGEKDNPYCVLVRKDPFPFSGSGTAGDNGFLFGYSDAMEVSVESMQMLLAHEIVHNWPRLHGDSEDCSWYDEGCAEYYCSVLPYRAGLITLEQLAKQCNEKVRRNYYCNSFRSLSNKDASKLYWKELETQRLPYGRGLLYLINIDAQLRRRSNNKYSLDNVVLELLHLRRENTLKGSFSWLEVLEKYLDEDPLPYYEAMINGELLIPDEDSLGGFFSIEKDSGYYMDPGFDFHKTFQQDQVAYIVCGLKSGSNAEKAGLQEGDMITRLMSRKEFAERKTEEISIPINRNGTEVTITYIPVGEQADVYYWKSK